jgi:uncharacterized protein
VTTESTDAARAGGQDDQVEVRSGTVLQARREDIELHTADGLRLVGELALPLDRDPVATLVTLHPLPTHGGFMDSHVLRKASYRLPALADIAVLRFNTRGTTSPRGTSDGTFDEARSERFDVAAAIEFAEFHDLPHRWLLGWSFGTDLALMHGHDPAVEGAILLSPPLRFSGAEHLQAWADGGKPLVALVPEHDDYLRPAEAARRFAVVPQARVVGVEGGRHLWVGETLVRRALDEIVAVVAPDRGPLPRTVPASLVEPDRPDTADAIDPADTDPDAARAADAAEAADAADG